MPDVTKPGAKNRVWLVTGTLIDAVWRSDWVLFHVEIDDAEACSIKAAARVLIDAQNPGQIVDLEMPVVRIEDRLCLKSCGRAIDKIRNAEGEDMLTVKPGATVSLKVTLSPYRNPVRGWRVTAFPVRMDVRVPASQGEKISRVVKAAARAPAQGETIVVGAEKTPAPPAPAQTHSSVSGRALASIARLRVGFDHPTVLNTASDTRH